jgi:hypothetical protein
MPQYNRGIGTIMMELMRTKRVKLAKPVEWSTYMQGNVDSIPEKLVKGQEISSIVK